jgi:hypothetical protein
LEGALVNSMREMEYIIKHDSVNKAALHDLIIAARAALAPDTPRKEGV